MRRAVRARLAHHDHDLAAGVAGAGDVVLLAIDDVLVAVLHRLGADVLGIRAGQARLGHRVRGPDLATQQRLKPFGLLLGGADALEHLHIAGVGRRAVERLRAERVLAEFDGEIGVVEVRQALTGIGEEEVPEAFGLGLILGSFEEFELTLGVAPPIHRVGFLEELLLHRVDNPLQEIDDLLVEGPSFLGHAQVEIVR